MLEFIADLPPGTMLWINWLCCLFCVVFCFTCVKAWCEGNALMTSSLLIFSGQWLILAIFYSFPDEFLRGYCTATEFKDGKSVSVTVKHDTLRLVYYLWPLSAYFNLISGMFFWRALQKSQRTLARADRTKTAANAAATKPKAAKEKMPFGKLFSRLGFWEITVIALMAHLIITVILHSKPEHNVMQSLASVRNSLLFGLVIDIVAFIPLLMLISGNFNKLKLNTKNWKLIHRSAAIMLIVYIGFKIYAVMWIYFNMDAGIPNLLRLSFSALKVATTITLVPVMLTTVAGFRNSTGGKQAAQFIRNIF